MDEPLGHFVGNALEVKEAIAVLNGESGANLRELCLTVGTQALREAGIAPDDAAARKLLEDSISSGAALKKLAEFVRAQGGDERAVYDTSLLPQAKLRLEVKAPASGYLTRIEAEGVGRACVALGGGRETKDSVIDLAVGIELIKKVGDGVEKDEVLAVIYANDPAKAEEAARHLLACYEIGPRAPQKKPFIRGIIR
jgi:pyrimidine-nucleoside phosphorylase